MGGDKNWVCTSCAICPFFMHLRFLHSKGVIFEQSQNRCRGIISTPKVMFLPIFGEIGWKMRPGLLHTEFDFTPMKQNGQIRSPLFFSSVVVVCQFELHGQF